MVFEGAVHVTIKLGPADATASSAPGVALNVEMLCSDMPAEDCVLGGASAGPRGIAIATAGVPAPDVFTPVTRKKYGIPFTNVNPAAWFTVVMSEVVAASTVIQLAPVVEYSTRYESAPVTAVHASATD